MSGNILFGIAYVAIAVAVVVILEKVIKPPTYRDLTRFKDNDSARARWRRKYDRVPEEIRVGEFAGRPLTRNSMMDRLNTPEPTLASLQTAVHEWANEQFPGREPSIAWMKMFEELGEVIKDPSDALEWADVFIVLLDLAKLHGIDGLADAILEKMAINRRRVWATSPTGVMVHVEGQEVIPRDLMPLFWMQIEGPHVGVLGEHATLQSGNPRGPFEWPIPVENGHPLKTYSPAGSCEWYHWIRTDRGMNKRDIHVYTCDDVPF